MTNAMPTKSTFILMADMIGSGTHSDPSKALSSFRRMVTAVNKQFAKFILSPLTITLGDEFQGILRTASSGVEILMVLEELRLKHNPTINLRYVLYEGRIDTPINRKNAHGMLGEGLTNARKLLALMKKDRSDRFLFHIKDQRMNQMLEDGFRVYQGILNDWKESDHQLILSFLRFNDYKVVAAELDKDVSLMWRRRKSLKIEEYLAMKRLINHLTCPS